MDIKKYTEKELNRINEVVIPKDKEYYTLVRTPETLAVGDIFFDNRCEGMIAVYEIDTSNKYYNYDRIVYRRYFPYSQTMGDSTYGSSSYSEFFREYGNKYIPDVQKLMQDAQDFMDGKLVIDDAEQVDDTQALVHKSSKHSLSVLHSSMEVSAKKVDQLQQMVQYKMNQLQRTLDSKRQELIAKVEVFRAEMKKIVRVISMIELYLGIDEELHHIKQGEPATEDTPITLRQLVLYADEELGIYSNGGIDYRQLHLFDEWLLEDDNYENLLPEPKGIVCIKPRRYDKDYGDAYSNMQNMWNHQPYFLIRNGENIYRICSENMFVQDTFLPKRNELQEIFNKINNPERSQAKKQGEEELDKFKDIYQRNSLFIQGLIDRSTVFAPHKTGIQVFDMGNYADCFNFVFDAEVGITDGKQSFFSWKQEINSHIGEGSRVLFTPINRWEWRNQDKREYLVKEYFHDYAVPAMPVEGVYTAEYIDKQGYWIKEEQKYKIEKILAFKYLPDDEVYIKGEGHEKRRQKVSWRIHPNEKYFLNYDMIDLEDVEYYLKSRLERVNYLYLMPVLLGLRTQLKKEKKQESYFAQMVHNQLEKELKITSYPKSKQLFTDICTAIDWWKLKNKWKRYIASDDTKALRMIKQKNKKRLQ